MPWRIRRLYLQVVVPVSLCSAVHGQIDGNEESVGLSFEKDFRSIRLFGMEQEGHLFPYQGTGASKIFPSKLTVLSLATFLRAALRKWSLRLSGAGSETLHLRGESGKGSLSRRGVSSLVVDLAQPQIKGLIEVNKGGSSEAGEKLRPHRTKETLDLSLSLRLVGPCVYESDAEGGRRMLHMMGAECRSVVRIDLPGKPSCHKSPLQSDQKRFHRFGEKELAMRHKP